MPCGAAGMIDSGGKWTEKYGIRSDPQFRAGPEIREEL
jgi:hypothetical protein